MAYQGSRSTAPIPTRSRLPSRGPPSVPRGGLGPTFIELVSMRMCGHAHHDDMLYLGKDPQPAWDYPTVSEQGYADRELYAYWSARDPLRAYAARLESEGVIAAGELARIRGEVEALVDEQARAVVAAPWPDAADAGKGVLTDEPARVRIEMLDPAERLATGREPAALPTSRSERPA